MEFLEKQTLKPFIADNFLNPCRAGKLFSENLQKRDYILISQSY